MAPAAGEYPRLLFRKSKVAAIRTRAQTTEGKAMVAQLKRSLGGGEAMPSVVPKATAAYQNVDKDLPMGAYTIFHGAGFGMLYQLTGARSTPSWASNARNWRSMARAIAMTAMRW